MDNIYKYKLFLKTIETGNITRTAEAFFVSQSAVSQQLKQLEEYFGKALFYKDKTLKLTPFGHSIHGEIRQLITYYENKENHIKQLCESEKSSLTIAAKTTFVLDMIRVFLESNNIEINAIRNLSTTMICESLANGSAHIGFGDLIDGYDELESEQILNIPIVLICKNDHPLANKDEISINELKEETIISYDDKTFIGKRIQDIFIKEEFYPLDLIRSNHSKIIQMLVDLNYGVGFIYSHAIDKRDREKYSILKIKDYEINKPYNIIYNKKFLSKEQRTTIDRIRDYFINNAESLLSY